MACKRLVDIAVESQTLCSRAHCSSALWTHLRQDLLWLSKVKLFHRFVPKLLDEIFAFRLIQERSKALTSMSVSHFLGNDTGKARTHGWILQLVRKQQWLSLPFTATASTYVDAPT